MQQLYYHDYLGRIAGHTTRAPQVGFELETNGFLCYAIANWDKTSLYTYCTLVKARIRKGPIFAIGILQVLPNGYMEFKFWLCDMRVYFLAPQRHQNWLTSASTFARR